MGAARRPVAPLHRAVSAGLHRGLPAGVIRMELWLQLAKPGAPVLAPSSCFYTPCIQPACFPCMSVP